MNLRISFHFVTFKCTLRVLGELTAVENPVTTGHALQCVKPVREIPIWENRIIIIIIIIINNNL